MFKHLFVHSHQLYCSSYYAADLPGEHQQRSVCSSTVSTDNNLTKSTVCIINQSVVPIFTRSSVNQPKLHQTCFAIHFKKITYLPTVEKSMIMVIHLILWFISIVRYCTYLISLMKILCYYSVRKDPGLDAGPAYPPALIHTPMQE